MVKYRRRRRRLLTGHSIIYEQIPRPGWPDTHNGRKSDRKIYLFLLFLPRRVQQPFPFPFFFRFHVPVTVVYVVGVTIHGDHWITALTLLLLQRLSETDIYRIRVLVNDIIISTVLSVHHRENRKKRTENFEKKNKNLN